MSWLPKRDKLDPVQASAIDFAVAQEGNFYIKGVAEAGVWGKIKRLIPEFIPSRAAVVL